MILLAYTIFTITLVLQRKQAARGLALGLASLTLPAVPLGFLSFTVASTGMAVALFCSALAILLFRGRCGPTSRHTSTSRSRRQGPSGHPTDRSRSTLGDTLSPAPWPMLSSGSPWPTCRLLLLYRSSRHV